MEMRKIGAELAGYIGNIPKIRIMKRKKLNDVLDSIIGLSNSFYKIDGYDTLLDGAKEYVDSIPSEDFVLILTSRTDDYKDMTLDFLKKNVIRYDEIMFNMPMGERIVVNDRKPSGLDMAIAVNADRNIFNTPIIKREL